jgi:hypothetical protein
MASGQFEVKRILLAQSCTQMIAACDAEVFFVAYGATPAIASSVSLLSNSANTYTNIPTRITGRARRGTKPKRVDLGYSTRSVQSRPYFAKHIQLRGPWVAEQAVPCFGAYPKHTFETHFQIAEFRSAE